MKAHPSSLLVIAALGLCFLQACGVQRIWVGGSKCEVSAGSVDDFFTQDILPGMESNLRKQRIYFVVGSASSGMAEEGQWTLAVDSVLVPMRLRTDELGAWQWSGGRNFYQPVREGVMITEEVELDASGLDPKESTYLIQRWQDKCIALVLPEVRHIGTVAMP